MISRYLAPLLLTSFLMPGAAYCEEPTMIVSSRSHFLTEGHDDRDWIGRARLLDRGDDVWICAYVAGKHHSSQIDRHKTVHVRFSNDNGGTWTDADTAMDGTHVVGLPLTSTPDQVLSEVELIGAPNGDLLLISRINRPGKDEEGKQVLFLEGETVHRSCDGGLTWQSGGIIHPGGKAALDYTIVDRTILLPIVVSRIDGRAESVVVLASEDSSATWTQRSVLSDGGDAVGETGIVALDDRNVLAVVRSRSEDKTSARLSRDAARTWQPWIDITDHVGVVQQPRLKIFPEFPNRLFLFGRARFEETRQRNGLWTCNRELDNWQSLLLDDKDYRDTGYGDALVSAPNELFISAYRGRDGKATTNRYRVSLK